MKRGVIHRQALGRDLSNLVGAYEVLSSRDLLEEEMENLRNRLIFRAADEADAVQAADFLGKKRVVKRSWGYSAGKRKSQHSGQIQRRRSA